MIKILTKYDKSISIVLIVLNLLIIVHVSFLERELWTGWDYAEFIVFPIFLVIKLWSWYYDRKKSKR